MSHAYPIPATLMKLYEGVHVCTDDWMIECDGCGLRIPAMEDARGSGDAGLAMVRALLAAAGWTNEPVQDVDLCAECADAAFAPVSGDSGLDRLGEQG